MHQSRPLTRAETRLLGLLNDAPEAHISTKLNLQSAESSETPV